MIKSLVRVVDVVLLAGVVAGMSATVWHAWHGGGRAALLLLAASLAARAGLRLVRR